MEGRRQVGSSSSFTSELFGTKESPPSNSSGIFASIFPPPSTAVGRNPSNSEMRGLSGNQTWDTKQGTPDMGKSGVGASSIIPNKDKNQIFQEERVEPCHLSSSLYYGGQDIYSNSSSTQTSGSYPVFKKDEDDPNGNNSQGASRGNWWQGSLYY